MRLLANGFQVHYIRPPVGIKDWNKMLVDYDANVIKSYILSHKKKFVADTELTEWIKNFEPRAKRIY